jgi:hypothetical protein
MLISGLLIPYSAHETFMCKDDFQEWSEPKISKNLVLVITEETIKAKVFVVPPGTRGIAR